MKGNFEMNDKLLDKRRKYYLILDTETATLPFVKSKNYTEANRKKIAIMKPLVYDIGWKIIDRQGRTYRRKNYLISEIFCNWEIFSTSYYANKRPIYLDKLKKGEIVLTDWFNATKELCADLSEVFAVGAYNSMFDFKKSIPFTEEYINAFYYENVFEWLDKQKKKCDYILNHPNEIKNENFDKDNFNFRNMNYPLFDIWGMACKHLLNNDDFKLMAYKNEWFSPSKYYFSTTAETAFKYFSKDYDFSEAHTAIDDCDIEAKIFSAIIKKSMKNFEIGITYFPFRILEEVWVFRAKLEKIEEQEKVGK